MTGERELALLLCVGLVGVGCAKDEPRPETKAATAPVMSPAESKTATPKRAPLATGARQAHQLADKAARPEQKQAAAEALEALLAAPSSGLDNLELLVLQDAAARAAALRLELGQASRSLAIARKGLSLSPAASVHRAHLLMVVADAHEALSERTQAREALVEALSVNQELLEKELDTP